MKNYNEDEMQAMFAMIIESSDDAIISKDLESRVISWNPAAEKIFGFSEAEMKGELIYKIIPKDRWGEELDIIQRLKAGDKIDHYETIRVTKSGKLLNISLTISPIRDKHGNIVGASKIARDITNQKRTEERLRIISETGSAINTKLNVSEILQIVTDATTKVSTAAFGAFFFNKVNADGESYMLFTLSGAPREAFEKFGMPRNTAIFKPTFEGTRIRRSDDITKDPDFGKNSPHFGMPKGHLPVVSYLAVPVISPSGKIIGGLFFGHPEPAIFTEEHERIIAAIAAQAAIAIENAKLYEEISLLNSKKDEFIGFASHELKTPLTTVKGFVQLVHEGGIAFDSVYDKVANQIHRLEVIINELLNLSMIQAGRLQMSFVETDLDTIISESIESVMPVNHKILVGQPQQKIQVSVDRQKLIQVLVNLLTNAVKYSPHGTTISIYSELIGDEVKVQVSDEGPGIPGEMLAAIFDPFYRVSNSAKSKVEGMGLGLYISKVIMEGHSGKISVESEIGRGSHFSISFPALRR